MGTMCDEMWNQIGVYGPQRVIDRFRKMCIHPELGELSTNEADSSLDSDADSERTAELVSDDNIENVWNYRDNYDQKTGKFRFGFDNQRTFPEALLRDWARMFPKLAFDCDCIADDDRSMGFGWFNPPSGGEPFRNDYDVPEDFWDGNDKKRGADALHSHYARIANLLSEHGETT